MQLTLIKKWIKLLKNNKKEKIKIMLSYKIITNNGVEVDLGNGYKVTAIASWDKKEEKYYVTLTIRENTTYNWRLIEDAERIPCGSNHKTIKKDMAMYVNGLNNMNYFKKYIEKYEYELRCFEIGNQLLEDRKDI